MIIVDTNVIAYLLIDSDYTPNAERLFQIEPIWFSPSLWKHELLNVLSKYLRADLISNETAQSVFDQASEIIIKCFEVKAKNIIQLIKNSNLSSYDCEFVALAHDLGCKLVTMDKKILSEFPEITISLLEF
jgi:predicted nucleic acid-binding protein